MAHTLTRSSLRLLVCAFSLGVAAAGSGQGSLSASQLEELDREGAVINQHPVPTGAPECSGVLERVARSQRRFLENNCAYYLALPNGDVINAFRALRMRELENSMRSAQTQARERLEREYNDLAPGGPHLVCFANGENGYEERDARRAVEDDTIYEFDGLPPLYELPVIPAADTLAAYVLLGSRIDSPEHNDFNIVQQTDHWLIGHVVNDGQQLSQRIAVHRAGARQTGSRLERSCVLWPLNRTAESRREYWDRSPLPLYVAINAEAARCTPADLACAVDRGSVVLQNYTSQSDRTRKVVIDREQSRGTGFVRKKRSNGPWVHRVSWRTTPVTLRIAPVRTPAETRARQNRQTPENEDRAGNDALATHLLELLDGRSLRGRLVSEATADPLEFIVVVGSLEQRMTFRQRQIDRVTELQNDTGG